MGSGVFTNVDGVNDVCCHVEIPRVCGVSYHSFKDDCLQLMDGIHSSKLSLLRENEGKQYKNNNKNKIFT